MRGPRIKFTIGRLMVAILLSGLALWCVVIYQRSRTPSIPEQHAEANYKQAQLVREVAEIVLKEYGDGIYPQDKATYHGQIDLARSDQERAVDRLRWSTDMKKKGLVSNATNIADQLAKKQADFNLELATKQLEVLEKYTKEKQIKSLTSDVEKARADEQARRESYRMERAKRLRWVIFGL